MLDVVPVYRNIDDTRTGYRHLRGLMLDVYSKMSVAASTPFPSILQAYFKNVLLIQPCSARKYRNYV